MTAVQEFQSINKEFERLKKKCFDWKTPDNEVTLMLKRMKELKTRRDKIVRENPILKKIK